MSQLKSDEETKSKEGILYADYISHIKPLDVVMFRGGDYVSDLIRFLERHKIKKSLPEYDNIRGLDIFSHVGIIVTSEILDDPRLEKGKLYIWESTMSGPLSDGVKNIENESFLGVQLRDFDMVVASYDSDPSTRIAIAHLKDSVRENLYFSGALALRENFTKIFNKYNGIRYDANLLSLSSSIWSCFRPIRGTVEDALDTKEWLFCSELIATVFTDIGIFPSTTEPKNVVPMDFLGYEIDNVSEGGIPVVVEKPTYIVSEK